MTLFYFAYVKIRNLEDGIKYEFSITTISGDLSKVITYFGSENGQSNIDIGFKIDLTNTSSTQLYLSNLKIQLYYENELVAITPDNVTNNFIDVQGSGKSTYNGIVKIILNKASVNLVTAILSGKTVNINYTVHGKLTKIGIPFVHSSVFSYTRTLTR